MEAKVLDWRQRNKSTN